MGFYTETASIEAEVTKLKSMRAQQEELIKECKVNIETMASNQRDCLVALESSQSFECKECGTDIGLKEDVESKCYQVGQGQFTEKKYISADNSSNSSKVGKYCLARYSLTSPEDRAKG